MKDKVFIRLSFILLFLLPTIESFDRNFGFILLFFGSTFISVPVITKKRIYFDLPEKIFLMFLVVLSISAFFSPAKLVSIIETIRYFCYFLVFISIRRIIRNDTLVKFFTVSLLINSILLIVLYLLYTNNLLFWNFSVPGMNLFYPVFGHNRISEILIFSIPVTLIISARQKNKFYKLLYILVVLLFTSVLIISFSRGAILSLLLGYFAFRLINKDFVFPKGSILSLWIMAFSLISIFYLIFSIIYSNIFLAGKSDIPYGGLYKPVNVDLRLDYFSQAAKTFLTYPIFGTGPDTFRYFSKIFQVKPSSWSWYTHNHFLQLFAETGFLGGILFIYLVSILFIKSFKEIIKNSSLDIKDGIFMGVFASLIHSFIDYDWQFLSIFLYFWMSLALLSLHKKIDRVKPAGFINLGLLAAQIFIFPVIIYYYFNSTYTILDKAKVLANQDQIDSSIKILKKGLKYDKINNDLTIELARLYSQKGFSDQAHEMYQKTLILDPMNSWQVIKNDFKLYLSDAEFKLNSGDSYGAFSLIMYAFELYKPYSNRLYLNYQMTGQENILASDYEESSINFMKNFIITIRREIDNSEITVNERIGIYKGVVDNK